MIGNKIEPFKFWCQKVLPNVYDDSLSYYEYLCKLNEYLNQVIEQMNTLTEAEEQFQEHLTGEWEDYANGLTNAWNETKNYIDNYFTNLNVQTEINNKLDAMALDGTLSTLLSPFVSQEIGGVVAEQIGGTVANQIDDVVASQIDAVVAEQIGDSVASTTTAWLTEHVDPVGSAVIVDNTLTISGAAADAKVTGDKIGALTDNLNAQAINIYSAIQEDGTFDFVPIEGSYYDSSTGNVTTASNFKRSPLIPVKGAKSIYLKKGAINSSNVWFGANGEFISSFQNDSSSTGREVAVPSNAYFFGTATLVTDSYFGVRANITPSEIIKNNILNLMSIMNGKKYNPKIVTGEYIVQATGAFAPSENWSRTEKMPCIGFDKLFFICSRPNDYNAWYDKDGNFISKFAIGSSGTLPGTTVSVPSNACYFALSNLTADMNNTEVRGFTLPIETLKCSDLSITDLMNEKPYALRFIKGEYVTQGTGVFAASENWSRTEMMPCLGFEKLYFICSRPNGYNAWYDKNGQFISNFNVPSSATLPGSPVNVPSNAYYFALSNLTTDMEATEVRTFMQPILGIRENIDLLHGSIPGVGTQLEYLTDNFETPIEDVITRQTGKSVSMVFITDSHHMQVDNQIDAVSSIEYIIERVGINAVIIGGDNHNDPADETLRENTIPKWAMEYMNEAFRLRSDILPLIGNHDDLVWRISNYNGTWEGEPWDNLIPWYFSPTQMYVMNQKRSMGYIHRDPENPTGNYYYYDIPGSDFRVLCLNTSDIPTNITTTKILNGQETTVYKYNSYTVIGTKQVNFVKNMLENYNGKLIVCSHANLNDLDAEFNCAEPINGAAIRGLLYAWKNGTTFTYTGTNADIPCSVDVSFANTHTLVGCFNGHVHYDVITTVDGIKYVSILNSQCGQYRDSPTRTDGTYSKIAYDVITVNPDTKTVYLTRFGAGQSRQFTYT